MIFPSAQIAGCRSDHLLALLYSDEAAIAACAKTRLTGSATGWWKPVIVGG